VRLAWSHLIKLLHNESEAISLAPLYLVKV
jgi:hypothetical protein